jgi:hypothetical protein
MPNEDLQAYQHHLKSFVDEYHPNTRVSHEDRELDHLLETTEMLENKGPKEGGFVFTQKQIDQAIQSRNRDRLLEEAYEAAA